MNNNNNKINTPVKVLYIICCILLASFCISLLVNYFNKGFAETIILGTISTIIFIIFVIMFIIGGIVAIVNFSYTDNKTVHRNLIIMFSTLLVISILSIIVPVCGSLFSVFYSKNTLNDTANLVIETVKSQPDNQYIYFLEDLTEINSSINSKLDAVSYATYFSGEVYICLSDGKHMIYGKENDLTIEQINSFNEFTPYEFPITDEGNYTYSSDDAETYIEYYLEKEYNYNVTDVEAIICDADLFGDIYIDYFKVKTTEGYFIVNMEMIDNTIHITCNPVEYEEFLEY